MEPVEQQTNPLQPYIFRNLPARFVNNCTGRIGVTGY